MRNLSSSIRDVRQWMLCLFAFLLLPMGTWAENLTLDGDLGNPNSTSTYWSVGNDTYHYWYTNKNFLSTVTLTKGDSIVMYSGLAFRGQLNLFSLTPDYTADEWADANYKLTLYIASEKSATTKNKRKVAELTYVDGKLTYEPVSGAGVVSDALTLDNEYLQVVLLNNGDEKRFFNKKIFTHATVSIDTDEGVFLNGIKLTNTTSLAEGVSYDEKNHTLTLDHATLRGTITTYSTELTISLIGENTINGNLYGYACNGHCVGSVTLRNGKGEPCSLHMISGNSGTSVASGFGSFNYVGFTGVITDHEDYYIQWSQEDYSGPYSLMYYQGGLKPITDVTFSSSYGIEVNYEAVTAENTRDILGDGGSVSYDPSTKTMTLRNATISDGIVWSNTPDLTINIVGENKMDGMIEGPGSGVLHVVGDATGADCSLTIDRVYSSCIAGFDDVEATGLNISTIPVSGEIYDGVEPPKPVFNSPKVVFTTATLYDIWLGLEQVTSANKDNVLGEVAEDETPTASYNVETNVLTLNNASFGEVMEMMSPEFVIGTDLTVYLIGENEFNGEYLRVTEGKTATFTTDAENPGSLRVWNVSGNLVYQNGLSYYMSPDEVGFIGIDQSEHYDIWVAGKQVTENNSYNILGDYTVSWDNETKTLILYEANIEGNIVSGLADGFNIQLYGRNTIISNDVIFNSTPQGWQNITITAEEGGMLLTNKTSEEELFSDYNSGRMWVPEMPEDYAIARDMEGKLSIARHYDLYLESMIGDIWGQQYVTEANCDRLLGRGGTATVTYDPETDVITLNNMDEFGAAPYGTTYFINKDGYDATLTINLVGKNILRNYADVGDVSVARASNIVFVTDEENPGSLTITDIDTEYDYGEDYMFDGNVTYQNGLQYSKDDKGNHYVKTAEEAKGYGLWIAGIPVTEDNAERIYEENLYDFSFDASTNTLTINDLHLDENTLKGNFIESSLDSLTIAVGMMTAYQAMTTASPAVVNVNNACFVHSSNPKAVLTVTPADDDFYYRSFQVKGIDDEESLFNGFAEVNYMNGAEAQQIDDCYVVGIIEYGDFDRRPTEVAGVILTSRNRDEVIGENIKGHVSFDPETHTLTFDNVNIAGMVNWGYMDTDLTVAVNGNNTITTSNFCFTKNDNQRDNNAGIYFVKAEEAEYASLEIESRQNSYICYGFTNDQYANSYDSPNHGEFINMVDTDAGLVFLPKRKMGTTVTKALITSEIEAPVFLSANADSVVVLESNMVENVVIAIDTPQSESIYENYGHVFFSVEYADGSDGVTDSLYKDGIKVTKPCTIKAYAEIDGVESQQITGMFFGYDTIQVVYRGEPIEMELPQLLPYKEDVTAEFVNEDDDNPVATVNNELQTITINRAGETTLYAMLDREDEECFVLNDLDKGIGLHVIATEVPYYGIMVDGIRVTADNAGNVLGNGTVSYDPENNVLMLNNAQLTIHGSAAVTIDNDNEQTTIHLKGRNIFVAYEMGFVNAGEKAHTLLFTTDEEQPGTLTMPFQNAETMFGENVVAEYANTLELVDNNQILPHVDIPQIDLPQMSICYTGKKVALAGNSQVYYAVRSLADMYATDVQPKPKDGDEPVVELPEYQLYSEPFTLSEPGLFYVMAYAQHPLAGDNPDMKSSMTYVLVEVVDTITFSLAPGHYRGTQVVRLQNLPKPAELGNDEQTQPQVWYFLGAEGDANKAMLYNDETGIELTESTSLSVFVTDQFEQQVSTDTITVEYDIEQIPSYGLWIGDIQANIDNRHNVLGDEGATVKFDGNHTLVLNKAMLQVPISTTLDSLTIYLVGDNSIATIQGTPFVNRLATRSAELTFTSNANTPGVLTVQCGENEPVAEGFNLHFEYNLRIDTLSTGLYLISVPLVPVPLDNSDEGDDSHTVIIDFDSEDFLNGEGGDIDLTNTVINNILYTIGDSSDPDGSGFDDGELMGDGVPGIVLNTEMGTITLDEAMNYEPGSSALASLFSGMTFVVPAGSGVITLDAFTAEGSCLGVKIGSNDPVYLTGLKLHQKVEVHFECLVPTYVYIFNASAISESRGYKGGKKTSVYVKIYTADVSAESLISVNSEEGVLEGTEDYTEPVRVFALGNKNYANGGRGIVIDKVMDKQVTELGEHVFDNIDQDKVKYIDLSESAIDSLTVNRTEGVFGGLSNNILILMPTDNANDGGEVNVVVDGQCSHLALSADDVKGGFLTPRDFTAQVVDFDRTFVANQPTSLYMPFDMTAAQIAQLGLVYSFTKVEGEWAHFDEAEQNGTKANTPYLLLPITEKLHAENVQVKRLSLSLQAQPTQLHGTFLPVEWSDNSTVYRMATVGDETRFVRTVEGEKVSPFEIYLTAEDAPESLNIYIDGVTNITMPRTSSIGTGEWYTIDGRRVNGTPAAKGVYILRGKKVMIK